MRILRHLSPCPKQIPRLVGSINPMMALHLQPHPCPHCVCCPFNARPSCRPQHLSGESRRYFRDVGSQLPPHLLISTFITLAEDQLDSKN